MQTEEIQAAYQRGFDYRCNGQYRMARVELQRVLTFDPTHVEARWQMGLIQGFEGDFDGSLETLQTLANENPENIQILNDLGMTQMMLGYQDEACASFHKVLEIDPKHENALRQVAYC